MGELPPTDKWKVLILLSVVILFAMSLWFSASFVVPTLSKLWNLNNSGRAWLTVSVQVGFVAGSVLSALLNLADRIPSKPLITISTLLAAVSTAMIAGFVNSIGPALILRFFTGLFMVGVYPVAMKLISTWTKEDRGLGIGLLAGAIAVGSASPHLLVAFGGTDNWRLVLFIAAGLATIGGVITLLFVREGPYHIHSSRFHWKYATEVFYIPELRLANLGYLGHMWELFAMWAWIGAFLTASFHISRIDPFWANLAAFAVIASGGLGSILAGILADRFGRTTITIISLATSGTCALLVGFLYGGNPALLTAVCLIWGFTVVADSAQFSAAISELCEREYTGTALTIQTSLGFLLTIITIWMIPTLVGWIGWEWAFTMLALGPIIGIWAMARLRRSPGAVKMSGGKR